MSRGLFRVAPLSVIPPDIARQPRVRKAANAWITAGDAYDLGKRIWKWWDEGHRYLTTVRSDDSIYASVHTWFMSLLSEDDRRSLVLSSSRIDEDEGDALVHEVGSSRSPRRIVTTSDDSRTRTFYLGPHKVRAWVSRADDAPVDRSGRIRVTPDALVFACRTVEGQQAVQREVERLGREYGGARKPVLHLLTNWGSWNARPDLPLRPLDSVVLRDSQRESIIDDFERFLSSERAYVERGIPWHRGYLFHGPPGTGKTSLARGLAQHFSLDLWYAPLGDLSKDTSLLSLLSAVTPRSILLLEDIDVLKASHEREGEPGQVSLSGLLNALDGVATPHGLIKIMTTNDRSALDPALIRPGRIDRQEHLASIDSDQAGRLFERFYGRAPRAPLVLDHEATAADLGEVFKQNMDDPEAVEERFVA